MPQGKGRSDLPDVMQPLQWRPAAVAGPAAAGWLSPSAPRRAILARTPERALSSFYGKGWGEESAFCLECDRTCDDLN